MYAYSKERHEFSRKMSRVAFEVVYRPCLGAVSMERTDWGPEGPSDPDLRGTDVVLLLGSGRRVTVAERFRRAAYIDRDDVTVRYASVATGRRLEAGGLNAQYMLYAVADGAETGFLRWDLLYAAKLMEVLERGRHEEWINADGSSSFKAVPRGDLFAAGAVAASSHPVERKAGVLEELLRRLRGAPGRKCSL